MNTHSKTGKDVLIRLFRNKRIFSFKEDIRMEKPGTIRFLPRKIWADTDLLDLEEESSSYNYIQGVEEERKIYFWSVEMGLTEILLGDKNKGKLSDLLCRFAKGMITHVVIAHKEKWSWSNEFKGQLTEDEPTTIQEEISIFSLTREQKQYISDRIFNEKLSELEDDSEFIFQHGYFPVK